MEKNQIVSLIIPIYNKEKYLKRCLDSVVNQTYRELEILLVDDGSTDASRSICEEYAKRDARIKVLPKENGGVSSARNLGMEHSTGTYLAFADPDDFMELDCIRALKQCVDEEDAEIAYCHPRDVEEATGKNKTISGETGERFVLKASEYNWADRYADTVSWGAVYRRSVTEGIRFDLDLKIGEDTLFLGKCIHKANKIVRLDKALYNYCYNSDSVTSGYYAPHKMSELEAWRRLCIVFEDEPEVYASANAGYALQCRMMAVLYCKDEDFIKNNCDWVGREFRRSAKYLLKNWWKQGRYSVWLKTLILWWFWDGWVRLKRTRKEYEIHF